MRKINRDSAAHEFTSFFIDIHSDMCYDIHIGYS